MSAAYAVALPPQRAIVYPKGPYLEVHHSLIAACDGDYSSAAILSALEFRSRVVGAIFRTTRAELLWFLGGAVQADCLRGRIAALQRYGFISVKPAQGNSEGDQFTLHLEAIQAAVNRYSRPASPPGKPRGRPPGKPGPLYKSTIIPTELKHQQAEKTVVADSPAKKDPPTKPVELAPPELVDRVVTELQIRKLAPDRDILAAKLAGKTLDDVSVALREFDRATGVGVGWFVRLLAGAAAPPKPPGRLERDIGRGESFAQFCVRTGAAVDDDGAFDKWCLDSSAEDSFARIDEKITRWEALANEFRSRR
jgi:hypothetical protein